MLRAKMPGVERVVDDRECDNALGPRPWHRRIGRQEDRQAQRTDRKRDRDEPDRLGLEQRTIGLRRIGKPCAREAMADPEQRRKREIERVECVGACLREPEDERQKPERVLHEDDVPHRPAHPGRKAARLDARQS